MKTVQERFEAKFVKGDGCWEWVAGKNGAGYGKFKLARRDQPAHRVAYQLYVGEIPEGLCCLHRCDNPSCVRPDHLFLGTDADNARDRADKGRGADTSGEKNGYSKLTEEQVMMIRAKRDEGTRNMELAKEFGVSRPAVSLIVNNRRWAKTV